MRPRHNLLSAFCKAEKIIPEKANLNFLDRQTNCCLIGGRGILYYIAIRICIATRCTAGVLLRVGSDRVIGGYVLLRVGSDRVIGG